MNEELLYWILLFYILHFISYIMFTQKIYDLDYLSAVI